MRHTRRGDVINEQGHDLEAVALRLRTCRNELGLSQKEVAERIGVTRRSVWGWENGDAMPRESLPALAKLYGRSVVWLQTGVDLPDANGGLDAVAQLGLEVEALRKMVLALGTELHDKLTELERRLPPAQ